MAKRYPLGERGINDPQKEKEMPMAGLSMKNVEAFCMALKEMLPDRTSHFGKEYRRLLLDEIRVIKKKCTCKAATPLLQVHFPAGQTRT
jgi:hypothetical protein